MGRYVDDILQPGEKVLYSTNVHWIFYLPAIAAWVVALALFVGAQAFVTQTSMLVGLSLAVIAALVALYLMLRAWF